MTNTLFIQSKKHALKQRNTLFLIVFLHSALCQALPTGNDLVAGSVNVAKPSHSQMQINQRSQQAVINWQGFSIGNNESVKIHQPNANAALLNRVIGQDASNIQGKLNANGYVYLTNPNGVLFSNTAQVDVGGLVASTHTITNQNFLKGNLHFTQNNAKGSVINQGFIKTPEGGVVALIGEQVNNTGSIITPKGTTALAAGKTVDLDMQGDGLVELKITEAAILAQIKNSGLIQADGGQAIMTAKAAGQLLKTVINNQGIVEARGLMEKNGKIVLSGGDNGQVEVSGTLDAGGQPAINNIIQPESSNSKGGNIAVSGAQIQINNDAKLIASGNAGGGTVVIGDKQATRETTLHSNANIDVKTRDHGKAGTIEIFANMDKGTVYVDGQLNASAPNLGDGGFIDTSAAHVQVADSAKVITLANKGKTGKWIIDPTDFTIAASGGNITGTTLSANLTGGDVSIASTAGNSGINGDVNVNDAVNWSANQLTLDAQRNININANLNGSGTAKLALKYGQASAVGGTNDNYFINGAKVTLPAGANFTTQRGSTGAITPWTIITSLGTAGDKSTTTLQGMENNTSGNYALGVDIDASLTLSWNNGTGFSPIGSSHANPFSGNFDGLGHIVSGLTINRPNQDFVGLFGDVQIGSISHIGLVNVNITGRGVVGGLVGASHTTISNAYTTGTVTGTANPSNTFEGFVGGLAGYNDGSINNAYSTASVEGTNATAVGGLVGSNAGLGSGSIPGNIGRISNAYATGNVNGSTSVGGLVGDNASTTNKGVISDTYATGNVTGTSNLGGLVGKADNVNSTITASFWDTQSTGQSVSSGSGSIGKTSAEMIQLATFSNAGWDISNTGGSTAVWRIYQGNSTPLLRSFLTPLTITANADTKTYNGLAYSGGNGVTTTDIGNNVMNNVVPNGVLSYSGSSQGAINRGTYIITPTGLYSDQQGFDITLARGNLTINPANLTIKANDDIRTFNGLAYTGGNGVVYDGLVNNETSNFLDGSLTYGGNSQGAINTGTYDITPGGLTSSNYAITYQNGQLTIFSNPEPIIPSDPEPPIPPNPQPITTPVDNITPLVNLVSYKQPQISTQYTEPRATVVGDSAVKDNTQAFVGIPPQYCDNSTSINPMVNCQKRLNNEHLIPPILNIKNSAGRIKRLQMSTNKRFLSLLLEDGSVRVWDFQNGEQHQIVVPNKNQILTDISAVDDKGELVSIATKAGIGSQDFIIPTFENKQAINEPEIRQFIASNDGSLILVSAGADQLSLWDSKQHKKLWQFTYERGTVNDLTLTDDKHFGAVLSRQPGSYELPPSNLKLTGLTDAVSIIDLNEGKIIKSLPNVGEQILSLQFINNDTLQLKLASGELLDWSIATNSQKKSANFAETVTSVDSEDKNYAYVLEDGTVRVGDGQGHVLLSIQNKENPFKDAILLAGDKKLLTVMTNGELSLWDFLSSKKLLRLFSTKQGWTVMDAFGRFDGSEDAMENFSWLANEEDIPLDNFSENYYEPGLLSNVLQGQDYLNSNPYMVKNGITLPPKVALQITEQQAKNDSVTLQLDVYDRGGGIDKVYIFQNGKILSNENVVVGQKTQQENGAEHRALTLNIAPRAGKNTLKVIASNDMGIENSATELSFDGKTKAYASTLKLLTVGIDQYSDAKLNLYNSVSDADAIGQAIKNNSKIATTKTLYNEHATKPKILAELKQLSQGVQQDVLVIYFAGHGLALGKEWYFLPYETKLQPSLEKIAATGITATELSDIFKGSKIQHILLMVDSCYSGAGLDAFSKLQNGQRYFTRKLSRSLGITVMAAAVKDQKAFESKSLGHGLFTYLVTQELDGKDKTKPVTAHGIAENIVKNLPVFSKQILGKSQEPAIYAKGNDFMLTDLHMETNKVNVFDGNRTDVAPKN